MLNILSVKVGDFTLKIAALILLLLAGLALEAAGAEGSSGLHMQVIDAGEILEKIQKGEAVEYDHVIVRGDLNLSWERLKKNITSSIRINDSIFDGEINFIDSVLEMPIDLSGSNFTRDVYFSRPVFRGDAQFGWAVFSGNAGFVGGDFRGDAYFGEATFSRDAYFMRAAFRGDAYFGRGVFSDDAYFGEAVFGGYAEFWGRVFSDDASFNGATFRDNANFRWATFSSDVGFEEATFSDDADLGSATFTGNSNFEGAEFNGDIEFGDAKFENETTFYRTLFKRPAYFENCSIERLNLTKAEYSRLHLRWGDIKSLHFDEAAYLALIKNYNNLGWYGDANRCYYDYRNAVRKDWQAASSPGFAAKVSSLLDRFVDFWEWILFGYGVRPSFPIAWSVGIILAFSLFFRQKRCLRKINVEERIEDAKDASDEVLIKTTTRKAPINALDPFLFSLFTFTSGFTAFLHPAVEYKLERCLRWAIAERLLGPFFLTLMITTISKTYLIR